MAEERSLGVFSYDVPMHRRKLYSRITRPLRGNSLLLSWSCKLFNWGQRDAIVNIVESLNKDPDTHSLLPMRDRIRYNVAKFDSSDQAALDGMVKEAYATQLKQMKEVFMKAIREAREPDDGQYDEESHRNVIKRARKRLREMESLALVFALTDSYTHALAAFQKMVEAEAVTLDDKGKDDENEDEDKSDDKDDDKE